MSEIDPETSPSGKPAAGYTEIVLHVWSTDGGRNAEVGVSIPDGLPLPVVLLACEHALTAGASRSKAPEEAVENVCRGARENLERIKRRDLQ